MPDQDTLALVKSVINTHLDRSQYQAFIFGSRTLPNHRKFCDLDVGIMGPSRLPASVLLQIKEDLSNSDLPYLADVVDFADVAEDFKKKALSSTIPL